MRESYIHFSSILLIATCSIFIGWLYWAEPKTLDDISAKASETIENVTNRTSVVIGTYTVDREKFEAGISAFRQDNFVLARELLERADPESRDAGTQFYIAYSFYREGWGRFYSDDELFKKGLEAVSRAAALNQDFRSDDDNLKIRTPVELKSELEGGLRVTGVDFNPFKVLRERK